MSAQNWRAIFTFAILGASAPALAQDLPWTLSRAIERAIAVAPEVTVAEAEVGMRTGDLATATAWPNPTIEVRADEKLGMQDGRGGVAFTQFAVTQPLSFRRRPAEKRAAEAAISAARALHGDQLLRIEREAAHRFHQLQLTSARRQLAREKLNMAGELDKRRDRIVRFLTPLERARLALLQEQARQELADFTRRASEAEKNFVALLALPAEAAPVAGPLSPPEAPRPLADLEPLVATHPEIAAARHEVDSTRAAIDVARARRLADPSITLFREQDTFGAERRSYSGVILGVQIPLWNRNQGPVQRARAEANRAEAQLSRAERDARARLLEAHDRLARTRAQAEQQQEQVVAPAEKLLALTRRSFGAGEANALALIDAYDAYFSARDRHVTLLAEAAEASADMRLAAGESLVNTP